MSRSVKEFQFYKDTLINEKLYHVLFPNPSNLMALREEGRKVYLIDPYYDNNEGILLYDFSLNQGDTLFTKSEKAKLYLLVVEKTDSVLLRNNEKRKRLFIGGDVWIEGIGSIYGLLYPAYISSMSSWDHLMCYWEGDSMVYKREGDHYCLGYFCEGDTNVEDAVSNTTSVYPNPVKDVLHVNFSGQSFSYKLFAISGTILKNGDISNKQESIHMNDLAPGIYLLELRIAGNRELHKIIRK